MLRQRLRAQQRGGDRERMAQAEAVQVVAQPPFERRPRAEQRQAAADLEPDGVLAIAADLARIPVDQRRAQCLRGRQRLPRMHAGRGGSGIRLRDDAPLRRPVDERERRRRIGLATDRGVERSLRQVQGGPEHRGQIRVGKAGSEPVSRGGIIVP